MPRRQTQRSERTTLPQSERPACSLVVQRVGRWRPGWARCDLLGHDRNRNGVTQICSRTRYRHHRNASLLLVSKSDGSPVKRIRAAGPHVGYRLPDGPFRILGFHHAQVSDVDTDSRRVPHATRGRTAQALFRPVGQAGSPSGPRGSPARVTAHHPHCPCLHGLGNLTRRSG